MYNMDFRLICGVGTRRRVHCRKCGRSHCHDQHRLEKIKIKWNAERWSTKDKDSERLEKFSGKQANSTSMWCELLCPRCWTKMHCSYLPTSTTCSLNLPVLVLACCDLIHCVFSFTGLLSTMSVMFSGIFHWPWSELSPSICVWLIYYVYWYLMQSL
jgi:hypothetical protein